MSWAERRTMVIRAHPALSLSRQCRLLSIGRSSLYYTPKGESPETLALMRRIDELFLKYPFYGARQMAKYHKIDHDPARVAALFVEILLDAHNRPPR